MPRRAMSEGARVQAAYQASIGTIGSAEIGRVPRQDVES